MSLVRYGGLHPSIDRTGEYKAKAAAVPGTILAETDKAGELDAATNAAGYVLEHAVVADTFTDTDKLAFLQGMAYEIKTKTGALCDAIRLHPGAILEVDTFAADTDTGALTKDTAVGTDLGIAAGVFREKQETDVALAELVENKIEADGTIVVRIVALA